MQEEFSTSIPGSTVWRILHSVVATKLREAQSAHVSTDSEKHKKINNLELKTVSLNVPRNTDHIKLDLNRSEAHVSTLLRQIRCHQDTISSLIEAGEFLDPDQASSVVSGHTTSCLTDRTQVAMDPSQSHDRNTPYCCDHEPGGQPDRDICTV